MFPSTFVRYLILIPFIALLFAGFAVPSDGSHGILSIKSLAYLSTIVSLCFYLLIRRSFNFEQWKLLCFLLGSAAFFGVWAIIGILYSETSPVVILEQFKIFWLTVSVAIISIYYVSDRVISFQSLLKTVISINFIYSLVKVLVVTLHAFKIIELWKYVEIYGIRYMSMDIFDSSLARFQTSIDIVTPFLLFFFLQSKDLGIKWSKLFQIIYPIVTLGAVFLSFSRFLIFVTILSFMLHAFTLKMNKLLVIIPIAIAAIIYSFSLIGFENVYKVIEKRFFSSDSFFSDQTRTYQINYLTKEFLEYPIFGKGLGGYVKDEVRDPILPYSYEVQWAATLMQFGMAGLLLILFPLYLIGKSLLDSPLNKHKVAFFILFLSWLASGFTNPFLLSLASGIIYSLFYLTGKVLSHEKSLARPC